MVIDEYIDTATPVSSRALAARHGLAVSTATIRNELARLEDEGYIAQPHTSAGRVPLDRGYRLYVEELMAEEPVGIAEQRTITHQFHQAAARLEDWLSLAATLLAGAVTNVAVIARPHGQAVHLRHVQLVELSPDTALVVAVMDDGRVLQRIVTLAQPQDQDALTELARVLNARLAGADLAGARAVADDAHRDERRIARAAADLIGESATVGETYVDGLRAALEQPEFASVDRMLDAVRHLQAYELMRLLPEPQQVGQGATRVVIGHENRDDWLREWSMVVSAFGDQDGPVGTIAVLGPTRMRYGYTIPRVRYVAALVSSLLEGLRR
jgi:heat-inducible transcriptional repressor